MFTNWIITVGLFASIASTSASSQNFFEDSNHRFVANVRSEKAENIINVFEATAFAANYFQNTYRDLRQLNLENAISCSFKFYHASADDKEIIKQHFKNNSDKGSEKDQ